jgi:hypothetical protein
MKLITLVFLTLFTLISSTALAASQAHEADAQFGLNRGQAEKHRLGDRLIKGRVHVAHGRWDFAVDGGGTGTYVLRGPDGKAVVLPNKAVVWDCIIDVTTPLTTSASGTMAFGTGQAGNDLKAATAAASVTGLLACVPVGTASSAIKLTADRTMTVAIATGALTAGKLAVRVQYFLGE